MGVGGFAPGLSLLSEVCSLPERGGAVSRPLGRAAPLGPSLARVLVRSNRKERVETRALLSLVCGCFPHHNMQDTSFAR